MNKIERDGPFLVLQNANKGYSAVYVRPADINAMTRNNRGTTLYMAGGKHLDVEAEMSEIAAAADVTMMVG